MTDRKLVIFGHGEIGRLAKFYFESDSDRRVAAFMVDDEYIAESIVEGLPVVPFSEASTCFPPEEFDVFVAMSYTGLNRVRAEKFLQVKAAGYRSPSFVCTKSAYWSDLHVGTNCLILENQTIQPNVSIGDNVIIWSGSHIGHGSTIADHCFISSHVVISGNCSIGERCFLGVNATLRDFLTIGNDCFISMDASVVNNMADGDVALCQSATMLKSDDRRARALKRQYFKT